MKAVEIVKVVNEEVDICIHMRVSGMDFVACGEPAYMLDDERKDIINKEVKKIWLGQGELHLVLAEGR